MAKPKTKSELIEAATTNYKNLLEMIANRTEEEKSREYDFSGDDKKKEAHTIVPVISRSTRETIDERKLSFRQDIDIRGMRGDEAINAVMYFIDDAILVGMSRVRILHGTGNGILRQLVRQYLSTLPVVKHFQDEHIQFGGAGITVVDL